MRKNFASTFHSSRPYLKKLGNAVSDDSKFSLPNISSKIGTLRTFLSVDDLRKVNSEVKIDAFSLKSTHKIYITLNEDLSFNTKNDASGKLNRSKEEQYESIDERKKLLYDKHVINRQKAAANICKMIVDEVKTKFGYINPIEDSQDSEDSEEDYDNDSSLDAEKLMKKAENCVGLGEKLDKISEVSKKFFQKNLASEPSKKKAGFKNELVPGEFEETISHESNVHRISKSKEKFMKEDQLMTNGDLFELFPETPHFSAAHKQVYALILQKLPRVTLIESPQQCFSVIVQKIELNSATLFSKASKLKKSFVAVNRYCISLPDSKVDGTLGQYIAQYFTAYRSLTKVDLSSNPIGDKIVSLLVHCFSNFSQGLEYLDVSNTLASDLTAFAVMSLLKNPAIPIQYLKLEKNSIRDEGLCTVCIGLLSNNSLLFINLADNCIENIGGLAFSKVIRINRSLKGFNLSKSCFGPQALREICRALIVNHEIVSVVLNNCGFSNNDIKEIGHLINASQNIRQICLSSNNIGAKGLEYLRHGLAKNRKIVHLALSGNKDIKLDTIDRVKKFLPKSVEVDIGKENDFFKSNEAKKYKLMDYIRYFDCA